VDPAPGLAGWLEAAATPEAVAAGWLPHALAQQPAATPSIRGPVPRRYDDGWGACLGGSELKARKNSSEQRVG